MTNSVKRTIIVILRVTNSVIMRSFRSWPCHIALRHAPVCPKILQNERIWFFLNKYRKYRRKMKESPAFSAGLKGRTTEGTLGRCSSTVANRARSSDGGGVSINFIKLAADVYST